MPGTTANYLLKEGNTFLLHGYKIPFIHVSPHNCFFWKGFYLTANLLVFLFLMTSKRHREKGQEKWEAEIGEVCL